VADPEHLKILQQGVHVWNAWRIKERSTKPDLSRAQLGWACLRGADFSGVDLSAADLRGADLHRANLREANLSCGDKPHIRWNYLSGADLSWADLSGADLRKGDLSLADLSAADLSGADLVDADLSGAGLSGAVLHEANLQGANLNGADLSGANLVQAHLVGASLYQVDLSGALLTEANLARTDLSEADLRGADLSGALLQMATLVETNLANAVLTGCHVYGISAWNVKLSEGTKQQDLVVTNYREAEIVVDNIEVAQFIYMLLRSEKIRVVIDTVGRKGVLLLGRFTEGRIAVLERLREELRKRGYLPIVFNFDKPETKDFTETVRLLAGLSKFVIADITNPKSAPLELQATVPEIMVPFRPIIEEGQEPFAMLQDLWSKHRDWVFEPIYYSSVDALIASLDEKIIQPAEARFVELLKRKADTMGGEHV
jgi:uncharacterized protein YjbI with pentapeptide repeats